MNWGKIYGEKRRGEKCLAGKFVCGEKCRGENCLGKNVVGKIVFWGKMLQSHRKNLKNRTNSNFLHKK